MLDTANVKEVETVEVQYVYEVEKAVAIFAEQYLEEEVALPPIEVEAQAVVEVETVVVVEHHIG